MEEQGNYLKNCVFCKIARNEESTDIVFQDENYQVFRDIKPATPHHYIVIPKEHLLSVKYLKYHHISVIKALVEIGKQVIADNSAGVDMILGFHWPPFNTIGHLHLHAISDLSHMSFLSKMIFKPGSYWFVTPEYVIEYLEKLKPLSSGIID